MEFDIFPGNKLLFNNFIDCRLRGNDTDEDF